MKGNIKFILFIVILFAIAFAIEQSLPRKFTWSPTFSRYDKEPFGSFVFDDVLSSSLPNGYTVTENTFYLFAQDSSNIRRSFLSVSQRQKFTPLDRKLLFDLVRKGNKVMLVSGYFDQHLNDTLKIHDYGGYFNIRYLKNYLSQNNFVRDSIFLEDSAFSQKIYEFYPQICNGAFHSFNKGLENPPQEEDSTEIGIMTVNDSLIIKDLTEEYDTEEEYIEEEDSIKAAPTWVDSLSIRVLARDKEQYPIAIAISIGEGELFMLANPLIFTNYGMLDNNNAGFIFSMLSYIDDLPVIRTEAYNGTSYESETPLVYFLGEAPLRWALYFTLLSIILFMIFTAKRRQRIIPVVKPPVNRTIEFTELIGTLYFQRKDYTDLVLKKYIYFAEQLKRNTYIDIEAEEITPELGNRLANKTGMEAEGIYRLIYALSRLTPEDKLDENVARDYIDRMNEVLNNSR